MNPQRRLLVFAGGGSAGPSPLVTGRLRVVGRHFQNDAGWFGWRGVADMPALGYILNGNRGGQVFDRIEAYRGTSRTVVRCCAMLDWAPPDAFSPRVEGYWEALEELYQFVISRGMYLELCIFADAQRIVPDADERQAWLDEFIAWGKDKEGLIFQIANEPFKNGWSEADDPALLALANQMAVGLGHFDFSVGDPVDGDNLDASAETNRRLILLSEYSNIVVMHPDRGSHGDPSRWRRWVDHLEGFYDVLGELDPDTALVFDEPMGAGPEYQDGRRDNDPDAFTGAQMVSLCVGCGYTYHWMPGEGLDPRYLPGIQSDLVPRVPVTPEWTYKNDSWGGAPTEGITWTGATGKMRNLVNGNEAWTIAYGEGDWNSVRWRSGWEASVVYRGARSCVWTARKS
jgi:hypothetical protein